MRMFLMTSFDVDEDKDGSPHPDLVTLINAYRDTVFTALDRQKVRISVTYDEADVASLTAIEASIEHRGKANRSDLTELHHHGENNNG
jgi:hypothetical protein